MAESILQILKSLPARRKLRKRRKELLSTVSHRIAADDDILEERVKTELQNLRAEILQLPKTPAIDQKDRLEILEKQFVRISGPRTFSVSMRSLLDVLAVALTVAFGIRGVFLQPFQIPTSSMQPTLFGNHYVDRVESAPYRSALTEFLAPLSSSEARIVTTTDGVYEPVCEVYSRGFVNALFSIFTPSKMYLTATRVRQGNSYYQLPGGNVQSEIYRYLDQSPEERHYQAGTTVFDGSLSCGDHLFVDRYSIHFLPLRRGEVFVFNTEGLTLPAYDGRPAMALPGYYYIKRIAGIGGDTLTIRGNRLYVRPKGETEFRASDEFSEKFRKVNSMRGGYQGHLPLGLLAEGQEVTVPEDCYFALGDNTANSSDSRFWGCVPKRNVIGRALFVFWPVSRRFGLTDVREPLPVDTVYPEGTTQPSAMRLQ